MTGCQAVLKKVVKITIQQFEKKKSNCNDLSIFNSKINFCLFVSCQCLEVGEGGSVGTTTSSSVTTTSGSCNQGWIADGYCDDINNNLDCTYDGGDCCGSNVNTQYCNICQCLE